MGRVSFTHEVTGDESLDYEPLEKYASPAMNFYIYILKPTKSLNVYCNREIQIAITQRGGSPPPPINGQAVTEH